MNQSSPPQIPPGWIALWDETAQRYYYVEQATGTTQWEIPNEASKAAQSGVSSCGKADSYNSGFSQPSNGGYPQQQEYSQYPQQGYPNNNNAVATSYPTQQDYSQQAQQAQHQQGQAGMAVDRQEGDRGIGKIFTGFSGGAITGSLLGFAAGKLLGNNNNNHHGNHHGYVPPPGPPPPGYGNYGPPPGYGGYGHPPKKHHHFF